MAAPAKKIATANPTVLPAELSVVDTPTPRRTRAPRTAAPKTTPKLEVIETPSIPAAPWKGWGLSVLEDARTGVFVCDADFGIVYANKKSGDTLLAMEFYRNKKGEMMKYFRDGEAVGTNLEFFFADAPMEFKRASDSRHQPYQNTIAFGSCLCDVRVAGIEENGKTVGYLVEWDDVTERTTVEMRQQQMLNALDASNTRIMIADNDFNVVYMNGVLAESLKAWEPELQKVYGIGFKADGLLGRCIDDFHKNPQHQRRMLANESVFPFQTRIEVGPLKIDLAINAIRDDQKKVVGYTTEWTDVTERLREEETYKNTVKEISDRMEFLRSACATDLSAAMQALANGDLTVEITPRTPLLDIPHQPDLAVMAETFNNLRNQTVKSVEAYNQAKQSLSELVARTRSAADSIVQISEQVAAGNDDLSQRTEEQASSLEETASSMEEMTSTVKQNADNARQANQLAAQAREVAEKGGAVVGNAVSSMEEINKASKRIADIISVIDEIAFQTNLLALNAAVEAARVGEQGRGFAVVAAEVRNLAGRSATAAKEIKALVQDSVQKVQEGSGLVNQSGQQLEEIVLSVKKVADIIAEISAASQEQAAGIEQVNKAIMQMDQITQQNAALVEEATAASQSMSQQAREMQTTVAQFRLDPIYTTQQGMPSTAPAMHRTPVKTPGTGRAALAAKPTYAARPAATKSDDEFEEF